MSSDTLDPLEERLRKRRVEKENLLELTAQTNEIRGTLPNTLLAVASIAFVLGALFAVGLLTFAIDGSTTYWWMTRQLGFFITLLSFFHWAEFAVTAGWNLEKCSIDSFLLNNGTMYHIAHAVALAEYLTTLYFKPALKSFPYLSQLGIILVIAGQVLRSFAMINASTNFSHSVAFEKRSNHRLVTHGVYAWFRHPSYAGFFYWALGTQLLLQNPISFIFYSITLWRFFYYRTRAEERALVKFFGQDYINYRQRVGTRIPFIA